MNEDIIRMAEEAGLPLAWVSAKGVIQWAQLERFAALVRADEREACAKVCDVAHARHIAEYGDYIGETYAAECARAIRARSKE